MNAKGKQKRGNRDKKRHGGKEKDGLSTKCVLKIPVDLHEKELCPIKGVKMREIRLNFRIYGSLT